MVYFIFICIRREKMIENNEISLHEFFHVIAKRKSIVILCVLVSVLLATMISYFVIPNTYVAETSVIVGNKADNSKQNVQLNDVMMYQNLVKTYANIGTSDEVYDRASNKLNNTISASEISGSVTIAPIEGTQILTITARATSAEDAFKMATEVTNSFIEVSNEVFPAGDIRIVDKGELPKFPVGPKRTLNIAIGFLFGLMIGIGITFVMEYYNNVIETEEDIKRFFDVPVLGVITVDNE
jgi:capsular polysaccharide biosynthesis protein